MNTFLELARGVDQRLDALARSRIPWWLAIHLGYQVLWLLATGALLPALSQSRAGAAIAAVSGFSVILLLPLLLSWRRMRWHQQRAPFIGSLLAVGLVFFATEQQRPLADLMRLPLASSFVLPIAALTLLLGMQLWDGQLGWRSCANASGTRVTSCGQPDAAFPAAEGEPHRAMRRLTGGGLTLLACLKCNVVLALLLPVLAGLFGASVWVSTLAGWLVPFTMLLLGGGLLAGSAVRKSTGKVRASPGRQRPSAAPVQEPAASVSDPRL